MLDKIIGGLFGGPSKLIGGLLGGFEDAVNTVKMSPEERASYKSEEQDRKKEENLKRMDLKKDIADKQIELRKLEISSKYWFQRNWKGIAVLILLSMTILSGFGVMELPSFVGDLLKIGFSGFIAPI